MNRKVFLIITIIAATALSSLAQGRKELRFNEVMTVNDSSYIDQYGRHDAWVEIFNSSYGTVGMEQMFVTNQLIDIPQDGPKPKDFLSDYSQKHPDVCYEIPRGDKDTKVAPRTHVVFFADGNTAAGATHLSYKLDASRENTLYLYDVNGDLVDMVVIPANLPADHSYALAQDGESHSVTDGKPQFDAQAWAERNGATDESAITPGKFNKGVVNENIEKFAKEDPRGGIISVVAMGIVFSALLMLFILFFLFGQANKAAGQKQETDNEPAKLAEVPAATNGSQADDEVMAAICFALYQHLNAHDQESGVLTFDRNANTAWSAKSSLMRELPQRR